MRISSTTGETLAFPDAWRKGLAAVPLAGLSWPAETLTLVGRVPNGSGMA